MGQIITRSQKGHVVIEFWPLLVPVALVFAGFVKVLRQRDHVIDLRDDQEVPTLPLDQLRPQPGRAHDVRGGDLIVPTGTSLGGRMHSAYPTMHAPVTAERPLRQVRVRRRVRPLQASRS